MSECLENRLTASTVLGHRVRAPSVKKAIYIFGETHARFLALGDVKFRTLMPKWKNANK